MPRPAPRKVGGRAALQGSEARPAVVAGRDDFPIEDQLMTARRGGDTSQLGIGPGDVPVQTGAQPQAAAGHKGDRPHAVPLELRRP